MHLSWLAALAGALLWATWRGGRDERLTALVLLLADRAAAMHHPADNWGHIDWISPALDLALLAYLLHRAMITTRWWPLYACAAQLAATLGLFAFWLGERSLLKSYFVSSLFWSYAILLALTLGTTLESARVREEKH